MPPPALTTAAAAQVSTRLAGFAPAAAMRQLRLVTQRVMASAGSAVAALRPHSLVRVVRWSRVRNQLRPGEYAVPLRQKGGTASTPLPTLRKGTQADGRRYASCGGEVINTRSSRVRRRERAATPHGKDCGLQRREGREVSRSRPNQGASNRWQYAVRGSRKTSVQK